MARSESGRSALPTEPVRRAPCGEISPTRKTDASRPGLFRRHCHILTHAESDHGMFGMVTALIVQQ
jgi:hypothetical protein